MTGQNKSRCLKKHSRAVVHSSYHAVLRLSLLLHQLPTTKARVDLHLIVWSIKKFITNMQYSKSLAILATVGAALAQRPSSTPICDYYTTALLKDNTAKNQYTLLTLLVNTAVIGNYTQPNVGVMVPGILAPGQYNGTDVNLLPYFDGGLKSTNVNQKAGVSNFLDGGGAAPLLKNMPADDTTSNQ